MTDESSAATVPPVRKMMSPKGPPNTPKKQPVLMKKMVKLPAGAKFPSGGKVFMKGKTVGKFAKFPKTAAPATRPDMDSPQVVPPAAIAQGGHKAFQRVPSLPPPVPSRTAGGDSPPLSEATSSAAEAPTWRGDISQRTVYTDSGPPPSRVLEQENVHDANDSDEPDTLSFPPPGTTRQPLDTPSITNTEQVYEEEETDSEERSVEDRENNEIPILEPSSSVMARESSDKNDPQEGTRLIQMSSSDASPGREEQNGLPKHMRHPGIYEASSSDGEQQHREPQNVESLPQVETVSSPSSPGATQEALNRDAIIDPIISIETERPRDENAQPRPLGVPQDPSREAESLEDAFERKPGNLGGTRVFAEVDSPVLPTAQAADSSLVPSVRQTERPSSESEEGGDIDVALQDRQVRDKAIITQRGSGGAEGLSDAEETPEVRPLEPHAGPLEFRLPHLSDSSPIDPASALGTREDPSQESRSELLEESHKEMPTALEVPEHLEFSVPRLRESLNLESPPASNGRRESVEEESTQPTSPPEAVVHSDREGSLGESMPQNPSGDSTDGKDTHMARLASSPENLGSSFMDLGSSSRAEESTSGLTLQVPNVAFDTQPILGDVNDLASAGADVTHEFGQHALDGDLHSSDPTLAKLTPEAVVNELSVSTQLPKIESLSSDSSSAHDGEGLSGDVALTVEGVDISTLRTTKDSSRHGEDRGKSTDVPPLEPLKSSSCSSVSSRGESAQSVSEPTQVPSAEAVKAGGQHQQESQPLKTYQQGTDSGDSDDNKAPPELRMPLQEDNTRPQIDLSSHYTDKPFSAVFEPAPSLMVAASLHQQDAKIEGPTQDPLALSNLGVIQMPALAPPMETAFLEEQESRVHRENASPTGAGPNLSWGSGEADTSDEDASLLGAAISTSPYPTNPLGANTNVFTTSSQPLTVVSTYPGVVSSSNFESSIVANAASKGFVSEVPSDNGALADGTRSIAVEQGEGLGAHANYESRALQLGVAVQLGTDSSHLGSDATKPSSVDTEGENVILVREPFYVSSPTPDARVTHENDSPPLSKASPIASQNRANAVSQRQQVTVQTFDLSSMGADDYRVDMPGPSVTRSLLGTTRAPPQVAMVQGFLSDDVTESASEVQSLVTPNPDFDSAFHSPVTPLRNPGSNERREFSTEESEEYEDNDTLVTESEVDMQGPRATETIVQIRTDPHYLSGEDGVSDAGIQHTSPESEEEEEEEEEEEDEADRSGEVATSLELQVSEGYGEGSTGSLGTLDVTARLRQLVHDTHAMMSEPAAGEGLSGVQILDAFQQGGPPDSSPRNLEDRPSDPFDAEISSSSGAEGPGADGDDTTHREGSVASEDNYIAVVVGLADSLGEIILPTIRPLSQPEDEDRVEGENDYGLVGNVQDVQVSAPTTPGSLATESHNVVPSALLSDEVDARRISHDIAQVEGVIPSQVHPIEAQRQFLASLSHLGLAVETQVSPAPLSQGTKSVFSTSTTRNLMPAQPPLTHSIYDPPSVRPSVTPQPDAATLMPKIAEEELSPSLQWASYAADPVPRHVQTQSNIFVYNAEYQSRPGTPRNEGLQRQSVPSGHFFSRQPLVPGHTHSRDHLSAHNQTTTISRPLSQPPLYLDHHHQGQASKPGSPRAVHSFTRFPASEGNAQLSSVSPQHEAPNVLTRRVDTFDQYSTAVPGSRPPTPPLHKLQGNPLAPLPGLSYSHKASRSQVETHGVPSYRVNTGRIRETSMVGESQQLTPRQEERVVLSNNSQSATRPWALSSYATRDPSAIWSPSGNLHNVDHLDYLHKESSNARLEQPLSARAFKSSGTYSPRRESVVRHSTASGYSTHQWKTPLRMGPSNNEVPARSIGRTGDPSHTLRQVVEYPHTSRSSRMASIEEGRSGGVVRHATGVGPSQRAAAAVASVPTTTVTSKGTMIWPPLAPTAEFDLQSRYNTLPVALSKVSPVVARTEDVSKGLEMRPAEPLSHTSAPSKSHLDTWQNPSRLPSAQKIAWPLAYSGVLQTSPQQAALSRFNGPKSARAFGGAAATTSDPILSKGKVVVRHRTTNFESTPTRRVPNVTRHATSNSAAHRQASISRNQAAVGQWSPPASGDWPPPTAAATSMRRSRSLSKKRASVQRKKEGLGCQCRC